MLYKMILFKRKSATKSGEVVDLLKNGKVKGLWS